MKCIHCANEIPDDSKFCPACGQKPQSQNEVFCPACGAKAAAGQRFCAKCGASLAAGGAESVANQPPTMTPPPLPPQYTPAPPPLPNQSAAATPPLPPQYTTTPPQYTPAAAALPLAGVMIRVGASLIDVIGLYFLGFIMAVVVGQTTKDGFNLHGFAAFVWWVIGFIYYIFFESKFGATLGKMLLGLKITKADGAPCDMKAAIIRTVCRLVDSFLLIGVIIMLISKRNQRLGDYLAGTLVVKSRAIKLSQIKSGQFSNFDD